MYQIRSVAQSCPTLCDPMNRSTPGLPVHHPTPWVHSDSRPLSQWCHPAISSSVVPFSSCPQSLPASESFPMSQLFASGGQSTGGSALASFLPKKSQGWSPSEWTGWISLQSKGLSRVFSNTTVQKHQFFSSNSTLGYISGWKNKQTNKQILIWKDTCIPMFIAALFTTAKIWKQPKCTSTDTWIRRMSHTHTHTHS